MQKKAAIRWFVLATVVVTAVGVLTVLSIWNPAQSSFFPRCLFYEFTSLHCPGCGTQRAIHQLLRGNILSAFFFNPLATIAGPFVAYGMVSAISYHVSGKRLPRVHVRAVWIRLLAFAIILFWLLRNVPQSPFNYFAPNWT